MCAAARCVAAPLPALSAGNSQFQCSASGQSGFNHFERLIAFLGPNFDPEKDSVPSDSIKFLGNIEDYSKMADDKVVTYPAPLRLKRIQDFVEKVIASWLLPSGEASSLCGQLLSISSAYEGRVGRGQLHYLTYPQLQKVGEEKITEAR